MMRHRRTYPNRSRALRQIHRTRAAHATYLRRKYADFRPRYVLGITVEQAVEHLSQWSRAAESATPPVLGSQNVTRRPAG